MNTNIDPELKNEVEEALSQEFEYEPVDEGLNTIYFLSSDEENLVLKVHTNPKNDVEWFKAESLIYQRIKEEIDIPSPKIVYQDFSEDKYENCFYIMERLEGQNPGNIRKDIDQDQLEKYIYQYGKMLGKVHQISLPGQYGLLVRDEEELVSEYGAEQWNWALEGSMSSWVEMIEEQWSEHPSLEYSSSKAKKLIPDKPKSVLVHSDNRLDNILVKDGSISGFLDWSHPWVGDSLYDLARAEYLLIDYDLSFKNNSQKERLREKLFKGYREEADLNDDWMTSSLRQTYRYATVLWSAAGFGNWGQHLEEDKRREIKRIIETGLENEKLPELN